MNSLKTLFMAAVLAAFAYGVYYVINHKPNASSLVDVAEGWSNMLTVDAGSGSAPGMSPAPNADVAPPFTGGSTATAIAPTAPPAGAPMFSMPPATAADRAGSTAPPTPAFASTPPPATAPAFDGLSSNTTATETSPAVSHAMASPAPAFHAGANTADSPSAPPSVPQVLAAPPNSRSRHETVGLHGVGDFASFMKEVERQLAAGDLAQAQLLLSQHHGSPRLTPAEAAQVERLLDQLAGTVIYSSEHFLEQPYRTQPTDTLESIARQYNVPVGFLAKINGLDPSRPLPPGRELKVVRGPFDATIDLERHELTLLLGGQRYAGRFPIGVGPEVRQNQGPLTVTDKAVLSAFPNRQDASRGTRWIGLGQNLGIHGTDNPQAIGRNVEQGGISLQQRDVEDLYDILTIGSKVTIRR